MSATRLLERRVDWFEVAYRVVLGRGRFTARSRWHLAATDPESGNRTYRRRAIDGSTEPDQEVVVGPAFDGDVTDLLDAADRRAACGVVNTLLARDPMPAEPTFDPVAYLRARAEIARRNGRASVVIGPFQGAMRAPTRPGHYVIVGRECSVVVDLRARELAPDGAIGPGWNVVVQWRALSLAERGFDPRASRQIAAALGEVTGEELRRTDLEATFVGFRLRDEDRKRLVVRSRARVDGYVLLEASPEPRGDASPEYRDDASPSDRADTSPGAPDDTSSGAGGDASSGPGGDASLKAARRRKAPARALVDVRVHGGQRSTGLTVAMGGALSARIYDKIAELLTKGAIRKIVTLPSVEGAPRLVRYEARNEKGQAELEAWRDAGADLSRPRPESDPIAITRVEFQLRGEALREFQVRAPDALLDRIDPIWRYCVGVARTKEARGSGGWMRMVSLRRDASPEPKAANTLRRRRTRSTIDPRWVAVRAVTWGPDRGIAARVRPLRGFAGYRQALGSMLGSLSEAGRLERTPAHLAGDEHEVAQAMGDVGAQALVVRCVKAAHDRHAQLVIERLLIEKGTNGAAEFVLARWGAAHARSARVAIEAEISRRNAIALAGARGIPWLGASHPQEARERFQARVLAGPMAKAAQRNAERFGFASAV